MAPKDKSAQSPSLAAILKRSGIIEDPDWVGIFLFVRNLLTRLTIYTDDKKVEIQRDISEELVKRDFSEKHLELVMAMLDMHIMQTIGALELEETLTREKRSAMELLNEMDGIIDSMQGTSERQNRRLDAFKEHTVGVIQSGAEQSVIVAKVRAMFQELITEFKVEAEELHARAVMLEKTANFDPLLTELHNRRAFDAYLQESVLVQRKDSQPLSLMLIDVDHFKKVNDTYGHQVGDDVLKALARILTAHSIQYQGFAARYGGEELVVVTRGLSPEIAVLKAEAIRANVEQYDFRVRTEGKLADKPLRFTVSIGVAHWQPEWDAGMLVRAADSAMYEAKRAGRNQVCEYDVEASSCAIAGSC